VSRISARLLPVLLAGPAILLAVLLRGEASSGAGTAREPPPLRERLAADSASRSLASVPSAPAPARTQSPTNSSPPRPAHRVPESRFSVTPPALPPEVRTIIPETSLMPASDSIPGLEPALFEVQLSRLARRVLRGYWVESQLLLPLADWLDFAQVAHDGVGPRITGRMEPSKTAFVIDADSGVAQLGADSVIIGELDLRMVEGALYGSVGLISRLFGLTSTIDREGATLHIHNPERLPIARRMQREAARAIRVGGEGQLAPELIYRGPERARSGLVFAYEMRGSSQNPAATTSYDFGVGMGAANGSAVIRARGAGDSPPQIEGAWSRAWPGREWLTQLRLGDGPSSGPRPQSVRGAFVTNAPINRAILVEDLPFAGTLPPDWSIEAYREGRLVGFDSVGGSGRYSLTLPIHYGENPVDFVAYGPFGEVRTFNRTFRALPSMVPAGALEYGASVGACRISRCDGTANLDLRYGASRRWTLRTGLNQIWGTEQGSIFHPYAAVVATPINPVGIELEGVANLLHRAGLRFEPSVRLRLTADYVAYASSGNGSPFFPTGTREQWSLYGRLMPGHPLGAVVFEAQGSRTLMRDGAQTDARVGAALQVVNTVLRPYLRGQRSPGVGGPVERSYVGLQATVLPVRALGPIFGGFWLQGQAETETTGSPTSAGVVISRNLGRAFRIEGGTRWERGLTGPILTFSLVSQLASVRSTSLVTAQAGQGQARLDQSIAGSVVWSRGSSALALSSEPSLDRSGVGGRVFLDLNGNAQWERDEPALPGTRLLVGNRWVTADTAGRYQVWGVSPYEEVLISVDSTSLKSPWWVPRFAAQAVTPTPNLVRSADVPVDIGGVIEGTVVIEGTTSQPLGRPLRLLLIEQASGTRTSLESFSDGSFYRMGLRAGRYEMIVEERELTPLGLRADTLRFELSPSRSSNEPGSVLSDLRLRLRAGRTGGQADGRTD
jgi:hypothetical protein